MSEPQLSTHLWLVLSKAFQTLRAHDLASIETMGLGLSDFAALEALLHKGPMPVNTLGEKVLLTSGSMTAAVDRLEKRRLVTRKPSPADRRVRLVALTGEGRRLIQSAFDRHELALQRVTAGLNANEKKTLIALLKKLGKSATSLPMSD